MKAQELDTCDGCGKTAPVGRHPCRFERACRCWWGEPCRNGETMPRTKRTVGRP